MFGFLLKFFHGRYLLTKAKYTVFAQTDNLQPLFQRWNVLITSIFQFQLGHKLIREQFNQLSLKIDRVLRLVTS